MPTKRKLWIVYVYTPQENTVGEKTYQGSGVMWTATQQPEFKYLSCYPQRHTLYRWTSDLTLAYKFDRKTAEKEVHKRGARIDYHPEFRYE